MKDFKRMTTNELIDFALTEYGIELHDFGFTFKENGEIKNRNKKQIAIERIEDAIEAVRCETANEIINDINIEFDEIDKLDRSSIKSHAKKEVIVFLRTMSNDQVLEFTGDESRTKIELIRNIASDEIHNPGIYKEITDFFGLEVEPKKVKSKTTVMNLYHGTNANFEEFDNDKLCGEDSVDQYGSGFYFYNEEGSSKTCLHGDIQVVVKAWVENPIEHNDNKLKLTREQICALICASPDVNDKLWNFGDIDHEGFDNVLESAIDVNAEVDWLDALNMIGNDFFEPEDTHILLKQFVKETGINCIVDTDRDIYVMLRKSDFEIQEVKPYGEDEE